jgi:hypothetical protein
LRTTPRTFVRFSKIKKVENQERHLPITFGLVFNFKVISLGGLELVVLGVIV